MESNQTMRKYELMFIVDARQSNEEKEAISKSVAEIINNTGGKIINSKVWLEKNKMFFTIKKCQEGTYYLINFESPGVSIAKMRSTLRLNEKVLRFAIANVEAFSQV